MDVKMPKLGESVHEGTIEQWLVKPGDTIEEYDALCEVITDKVTAEVPSTFNGTIKEIVVEAGETVDVGTVICTMEVEGETSEENNNSADEQTEPEVTKEEQPAKAETPVSNKPQVGPMNNGQYSPVVFKLASENNIDLNKVKGTGNLGRVTKKDILNAIENGVPTEDASSKQVDAPVQEVAENTVQPETTSLPGDSIPVNGVRRAIANKMLQSVHEIPHAWMMVEVDATDLVKTRQHHKSSFKQNEGYNLTFFAFFVKAVAEGLKKYPMLNSTWAGDEIKIHKDINISIAVASEDKLYVPVIKNADDKSIKGIAREINDLATRGRKHKLTSQDMQGGTFTVNNTGSFGSVSSMGIINHPQAAILQVESIVKRPVVVNDMIGIRDMVNLSLSIDHRILDGLMAGEFLKYVKERLQSMTIENTSIY
ncbi:MULTISPECIES: dihydrolipoamide acetyltransferase family protein [Mammaliicoccus]|uniref:Dihydrolipoamide acetyltransferase component of pyruvate dehydrogenase complex n=1 Tax=Mammaliicoccus sciuri TaxID=1296 RepID=A0AAJ4SGJ4_MAMSC|nr:MULTISPECIES: dihydrolipoamide acetyltransferase family protein [Mammaliicoccus]MCJ0913974.1 2-oxo acid dehydrogenase subunit E2 [Mammaliicoccus sciuri]MDL0111423.1 dihydrolipoamide acetyltransferase family protein [Mammaliicoccus sciuri]MDL0115517.1 dihydrolipoamide acetyltransferase family protein [Mammaliicoccus sciuri]RTX71901.1 2-oxo acid dehydrogenase subunit E2 [Mammaliicoccus sciuri]WQJ64562.1 dihydrolipoamide acetyltransferase family protein [Mammaliicoccus sciuri]